MKHWEEDLAKLAKTPGTLTFEALSPGLGLSTPLREVQKQQVSERRRPLLREPLAEGSSTPPRKTKSDLPVVFGPSSKGSLSKGLKKQVTEKNPTSGSRDECQSAPRPWYLRVVRFIVLFFFAHLTDLVVVAVSLVLAFWGVSFFLYGKPLSSYTELFTWVRHFSLLEVLLVLYSVFSVYFVIFKVLVGATFGRRVF